MDTRLGRFVMETGAWDVFTTGMGLGIFVAQRLACFVVETGAWGCSAAGTGLGICVKRV